MGHFKALRQRAIASVYAPLIARHARFIKSYKQDLFSEVRGRVIEIGPGTGGNLEFLGQVQSWVGMEPNPYMHTQIRKKLTATGITGQIVEAPAERLPFADASFDYAISTLVLCSVTRPDLVIRELRRVLKPGGKLLFVEHVAAPAGTWLRTAQNLASPIYRCCGDGCFPNRETGLRLQNSGFDKVEFQEFRAPWSALPPVVSPHIAGFAQT